jgi:hypothetical protein
MLIDVVKLRKMILILLIIFNSSDCTMCSLSYNDYINLFHRFNYCFLSQKILNL